MDEDIDIDLFSPAFVKVLHKNLTTAGRICKEACDIIIIIIDTYEAHRDWTIKEIIETVWKEYIDCDK